MVITAVSQSNLELEEDERILMFASEYSLQRVGGLGTHVRGLAPRLSNHVSMDLVVPRYQGIGQQQERLGSHGVLYRVDANVPKEGNSFDIDVWHMNDRLAEFVTHHLLSQQRYALVHAHDWLTGYVVNNIRRFHALPMVVTFHATESGRAGHRLSFDGLSERIHLAELHLAREADLVIACSHFMRNEVVQVLGADPNKVVIIPNGIETSEFLGLRSRYTNRAQLRRQWAPDEAPLVLFVGRLVWEKGVDVLVSAMAQVVQRRPDARAIIAGRGPFEYELRHLIGMLGLEKNVHLTGFISDEIRNQLYAVADVAVFPSRYEPFGIVALEAMTAGIPVIVSGVGGLQEVVADGKSGLTVEAGRADLLAEAILTTILDLDGAGMRAELAERVACEGYSWEKIADQTLRAYAAVLGPDPDALEEPGESNDRPSQFLSP